MDKSHTGNPGYLRWSYGQLVQRPSALTIVVIAPSPHSTVAHQGYCVIAPMRKLSMQLTTAKAALRANTAEVLEYEAEVIKIIRGDSKLNPDLLNKLYEDAKAKAVASEQTVKSLELQIQGKEQMRDSLSRQFGTMRTWADMYDECDMETKKMIISRIMKSVKVKRGYDIEIDFTVDFEQIRGQAHLGLITDNCLFFPDEATA